MTAFLGINCAAAQPGPTRSPILGGDGGGNLRGSYDSYLTLGTEQIGDTVQFGDPLGGFLAGDRVRGVSAMWGALGAGATFSIGDAGVAARFLSAINAANAAAAPQGINVIGGFGWQADIDRPLLLTFAGAAPAAGKLIQVFWDALRS